MRKLVRSFVLFCAIAGVVASAALSDAPARQKDDKKDPKKDDKKDDKKDTKGAADVGAIEVYMAKDGWRIRVKNAEGKSVAIGTVGYDKQEDALKTVDFLKNTFAKGKVSVEKADKK
jgi:uncharacterized protein YegP (UPF0339 family)